MLVWCVQGLGSIPSTSKHRKGEGGRKEEGKKEVKRKEGERPKETPPCSLSLAMCYCESPWDSVIKATIRCGP
jgi:hypothetical protein